MDKNSPVDRITLHLKADRQVRDRLLGSLRSESITMQEFFEDLMRTLVRQPERIHEIQTWAEPPQVTRKAPGRPPRVHKRRTPTPAP